MQPTTAQLRDDIDRGLTGDKVRAIDPAAAPLGTDDEAAGTPPSGEAVRQARDYERAIGRRVNRNVEEARDSSGVWIYVLAIMALVAFFSTGVWLSHRP
jgi:hypothetical protein